MARLVEIKGGELPQQQQSTGSNKPGEMVAQVSTFKWAIPINTYLANVANARVAGATKTAEDWFNEGNDLYASGRYKEAIASYEKAIEINPKYTKAWYGKGNALSNWQQYEKAIASYDKAIQIKPDDADAWYARGYALGELQHYPEAIASYDKAIQIKPDSDRLTAIISELRNYQHVAICAIAPKSGN